MSEIPYDWARYTCPTCDATPQQRCRSLTTHRVTDAHAARRDLPTQVRLAHQRARDIRRTQDWSAHLVGHGEGHL